MGFSTWIIGNEEFYMMSIMMETRTSNMAFFC